MEKGSLLKNKAVALALTLLLLALALVELGSIKVASAGSDDSFPVLAMPLEYVNCTITAINGSLWTMIDGDYPIFISNQPDYGPIEELPMVYPMPPNTTHIHVYLADKELSWTNYTQTYPDQLHHTAIGDWWMIHSVLGNVTDFFELKIHYEHPLQIINGRYMFLYDLNINPYLSPQNNNSICIYTIHVDANISDLQTYTAETDLNWNPIDRTSIKEDTSQTIIIREYSEYGKPLLGDLVIEFSSTASSKTPLSNQETFQTATIVLVLGVLAVGIVAGLLLFFKKHKRKVANQENSLNNQQSIAKTIIIKK